jgi:hypothetical protein
VTITTQTAEPGRIQPCTIKTSIEYPRTRNHEPTKRAEPPRGAACRLPRGQTDAPARRECGAGGRTTREFAEYRPYTNISQFRGEIGKHVSPEEVAALEAYLFVSVAPSQPDVDSVQQRTGVNADVAQTLASAGPFNTVEALLAVSETTLVPELAFIVMTYVVDA